MAIKEINFVKMHGCGNDFVIIKTSDHPYLNLSKQDVTLICDRHLGVGCDQLVIIDKIVENKIYVHFYNADGSELGMCGNGVRCIAELIYKQAGHTQQQIFIGERLVLVEKDLEGWKVNMGKVLPLAPFNHDNWLFAEIGNPHAVLFVDQDPYQLPLSELSRDIIKFFPDGINISLAQIISSNSIKLRVCERGAGETLACGSAACTTFALAYKTNKIENDAEILQKGGRLIISNIDDDIYMTGAATFVFSGVFSSEPPVQY